MTHEGSAHQKGDPPPLACDYAICRGCEGPILGVHVKERDKKVHIYWDHCRQSDLRRFHRAVPGRAVLSHH